MCYNTRMNKMKRILAIICIVLLLGLYITTFVMSLLDSSATLYMFNGCIICTIFIPLVAYVFICLHKYAMTRSGRRDYYSPDSSAEPSEQNINPGK